MNTNNTNNIRLEKGLSEKDLNRVLMFISFMLIFTIVLGSIVGFIWFGFSGFLEVLFLLSCYVTFKLFKY